MMIASLPLPPPVSAMPTIISLCVRHRQLISVVRTKTIITLSVILNCGVPLLRGIMWHAQRISFDLCTIVHFIHTVCDPGIFRTFASVAFEQIFIVLAYRVEKYEWYFRKRKCVRGGRVESEPPLSTKGVFYYPPRARVGKSIT